MTKKVGIFDNYYEPAKLTIPKGSTVKWQWPITTGDTHDVTLKKGPKGVKKFQSEIAASDYVYSKKFTVHREVPHHLLAARGDDHGHHRSLTPVKFGAKLIASPRGGAVW